MKLLIKHQLLRWEWWFGEREFLNWLSYSKKHHMCYYGYGEKGRLLLEEMITETKLRIRLRNLFRTFDKWTI